MVTVDIRKLFEKAAPLAQAMYDRVATVKRKDVEVVKANGATSYEDVDVYVRVPCRLSVVGVQTLQGGDLQEVNRVQYDAKLFISNEYPILAGDEVTVELLDAEGNTIETDVFKYAKKPFSYVMQQEVLLKRDEFA